MSDGSATVQALPWPEAAVFPPRGLTVEEQAIPPNAWQVEASDGYRLTACRWSPRASPPRAFVVVLHGVQSHAGWYHGLGKRLAAAGFETVFPDRRGSGANREARGHAPSATRLVADVADVLRAIRAERTTPGDRLPTILAGISWGGKLVIASVAAFPDLVEGIALIAPGLRPRVGVTFRERLGVATALVTGQAARRMFPIPLADPALFTDDTEAQAFIRNDPLSLREGTAGLLASSAFLDRRVRRGLSKVHKPALLMLAGRDRIVNNAQTRDIFRSLSSPELSVIEYPEAHHTLEFEADPARYARDLVGWIESHLLHPTRR